MDSIETLQQLVDPEALRQKLLQRCTVLEETRQHTRLKLILPANAAEFAPTPDQVKDGKFNQTDWNTARERTRCWLETYFDGAGIEIGDTPSHIDIVRNGAPILTPEGKPVKLPAITVTLRDKAKLAYHLLAAGRTDLLPDHRAIAREVASDAETLRFIAERTQKINPLADGRTRVTFSIPTGTANNFCERMRGQFRSVAFKPPGDERPMVKLGATLTGEDARRFIANYEQFRG